MVREISHANTRFVLGVFPITNGNGTRSQYSHHILPWKIPKGQALKGDSCSSHRYFKIEAADCCSLFESPMPLLGGMPQRNRFNTLQNRCSKKFVQKATRLWLGDYLQEQYGSPLAADLHPPSGIRMVYYLSLNNQNPMCCVSFNCSKNG